MDYKKKYLKYKLKYLTARKILKGGMIDSFNWLISSPKEQKQLPKFCSSYDSIPSTFPGDSTSIPRILRYTSYLKEPKENEDKIFFKFIEQDTATTDNFIEQDTDTIDKFIEQDTATTDEIEYYYDFPENGFDIFNNFFCKEQENESYEQRLKDHAKVMGYAYLFCVSKKIFDLFDILQNKDLESSKKIKEEYLESSKKKIKEKIESSKKQIFKDSIFLKTQNESNQNINSQIHEICEKLKEESEDDKIQKINKLEYEIRLIKLYETGLIKLGEYKIKKLEYEIKKLENILENRHEQIKQIYDRVFYFSQIKYLNERCENLEQCKQAAPSSTEAAQAAPSPTEAAQAAPSPTEAAQAEPAGPANIESETEFIDVMLRKLKSCTENKKSIIPVKERSIFGYNKYTAHLYLTTFYNTLISFQNLLEMGEGIFDTILKDCESLKKNVIYSPGIGDRFPFAIEKDKK